MLIWIFIGTAAGFIARGLAYAYLTWRNARAPHFGLWPEIIGGCTASLLAWNFREAAVTGIHLLICVWLLSACLIDVAIRELPDIFTLGGLVCGLFLSAILGVLPEDYILGAICGAGAYHLTNIVTKQHVFGSGDVKFAAFLGGMAGLAGLPLFLAGSMGGLMLLIVFSRAEKQKEFPFSPIMGLAYLSTIFL